MNGEAVEMEGAFSCHDTNDPDDHPTSAPQRVEAEDQGQAFEHLADPRR
jgi:hypothetical protein